MTKQDLERKILDLRKVQINIQHSITELVLVNSQLDGEITELVKLADQV